METNLAPERQITYEEMGVGVTSQQEDLKEEKTGSPNACASSKPWQDISTDDGLDLEKQKGTEENRDGKEFHEPPVVNLLVKQSFQEGLYPLTDTD